MQEAVATLKVSLNAYLMTPASTRSCAVGGAAARLEPAPFVRRCMPSTWPYDSLYSHSATRAFCCCSSSSGDGLLSQQPMHVAGFLALSLFCCPRESATNGSSRSHPKQRPTRCADIAARGGSIHDSAQVCDRTFKASASDTFR